MNLGSIQDCYCVHEVQDMYLPDRERESEREQERGNKVKRGQLKSYERKNECEERWISTFTKRTNGQRKKIEWQMRTQLWRAGRYKENRQIRKKHWLVEDQVRREVQHPRVGVLVGSPTQSEDHHSHPGMLYHCHLIVHMQVTETWETGRDIYALLLLPISPYMSAAWTLLLQTDFIYDSISALPARESDLARCHKTDVCSFELK